MIQLTCIKTIVNSSREGEIEGTVDREKLIIIIQIKTIMIQTKIICIS